MNKRLKGFKQYISEGFQDMEKAVGLIAKYMTKKLGKLIRDPDEQEFKKADGNSGVGVLYYCDDIGKKIRFNWVKGTSSSEVTSIDVFERLSDNQPTFTIDCEGESVSRFLPIIVNHVLNPVIGEYNESFSYDDAETFILETKAGEIEKLFNKGKTPSEIVKMGYLPGTVYQIKKKLGIANVRVSKSPQEHVEPSAKMKHAISSVYDDSKVFETKMDDVAEISAAIGRRKAPSLLICGRAGTGKTFTVTKVLQKNLNLTEGKDYLLVKAGVSAVGAYQQLYIWREKVIVFDDADGIFDTEEGRNMLKAALDDKKVRKLSWFKKSSFLYDPVIVTDEEEREKLEEKGMMPNQFEYKGSCVFISNKPRHVVDPDGALRSRSFVIDINPSNMAILERIEALLPVLGNEDYPELSSLNMTERREIFEYVKKSKQNSDDVVTIREIVRAMNAKSMGMKNWQRIVGY